MVICSRYQFELVAVLLALLSMYDCEVAQIYRRRPQIDLLNAPGICVNPSNNTNSQISTGNCQTYLYYIQMGIGTPPQNFYFQVDTGSYIQWIPLSTTNSKGFVSNKSSTLQMSQKAGSVSYADLSSVSGKYGTDNVTVLPSINIRQTILFANQEIGMTNMGPTQGLVGMGYTSQLNFLDIAYQAGQIKTNVFALQLGAISSQSYMYYNQIPSKITNSTLYSSVTTSQGWQLQVVGVYADDTDLTSYSVTAAVIDSGTSLFYLNPNLYNQIKQTYLNGCTKSTSTNYFLCNCSANPMPTLKFQFPGVQVQLPSSSYVTNISNGNCEVYLNSLADQSSILLLGDTLFQRYVITFDKNQAKVGFSGENVVEIYIVGSNSGFIVSQYIMLSFSIILFIIFIIFICLMCKKSSNNMLRQQLNQTSRSTPMEMSNFQYQKEYI